MNRTRRGALATLAVLAMAGCGGAAATTASTTTASTTATTTTATTATAATASEPIGPDVLHLAIPDPSAEGPPIQPQALLDAPHLKVVAIVLRDGTLLPEHTSPFPVTIAAISGGGTVRAGGEELRVDGSHLVSLRARVPHEVQPDPGTDLVLLVHHIRR